MEKNFYDTSVSNLAIVSDGSAANLEADPSDGCLSAPPQGDTSSSREGQQIVLKNVQVKGIIRMPTRINGTPIQAPTVYLALVLDTQSNGAQLNSEDVFKTSANGVLNATMFRNLEYRKRFRLLKTATINMPEASGVYSGVAGQGDWLGEDVPFEMFHVFKDGLEVNFRIGAASGIANVIDNSLHVIAACSDTASGCLLYYHSRIRYTA